MSCSAVKIENFVGNYFDVFNNFAQNIDCGYTLEPPLKGGSNEYPQSMFWSKNKKNMYIPAYPSYTKGYILPDACFARCTVNEISNNF